MYFIIHVHNTREGLSFVRFLNNAYARGETAPTGHEEPLARFFGTSWDAATENGAHPGFNGIAILPGINFLERDGRACISLDRAVKFPIEHEILFDGRLVTRDDTYLSIANRYADMHGDRLALDNVEWSVKGGILEFAEDMPPCDRCDSFMEFA